MYTYISIKAIKFNKPLKLQTVVESKHIVQTWQEISLIKIPWCQKEEGVKKKKIKRQRLKIFLWLRLAHTARRPTEIPTLSFLTTEYWQEMLTQTCLPQETSQG